jgi:hypothetical protein
MGEKEIKAIWVTVILQWGVIGILAGLVFCLYLSLSLDLIAIKTCVAEHGWVLVR